MRLVADWRRVMRHAWSVRLMALAGILSGFEAALPYLPAFLSMSPAVLATLTGIVVAAAFISRLVAQEKLDG